MWILYFLGNTGVQVSKTCFRRLKWERMSLFAQEIAMLVFGQDALASPSLTGKSGLTGTPKHQLNPERLSALDGMYWLHMFFIINLLFFMPME